MDRERSVRFDGKAREYKDLQEILKKLIKTEENIYQTRTNFKKKWLEIANIENNQDLSRGLTSYSKALDEIERSHRENLVLLKSHILEGIKKIPDQLKEQRRSLSACAKAEKDYDDSKVRLDRLQSTRDQRNVNSKELSDAATMTQEKQSILEKRKENTERTISEINRKHDEDARNLIMTMIYNKISHHSSAIQVYTEAFREILSIADYDRRK